MAINPDLLIVKSVGELKEKPTPSENDQFLLYDGNELKKSKWSNVQDQITSAYLGIATTTTTPPATGAFWYKADTAGTYANFGGIVVTTAELLANFVYIEVTNGVAKKVLSAKPVGEYNEAENLAYFTDKNGAVYGSVNSNGEFDIKLDEEAKADVNYTGVSESDFLEIFSDKNGAIYGYVDLDGVFHVKVKGMDATSETKSLTFSNLELIKDRLILQSTAVGRSTTVGSNDGKKINLTDSGYTHPKVIYVPKKFAGFYYWMAITPTFGDIALEPDPASYENPTIFCSNDGENWQTPEGLINPIDVTAPLTYDSPYPFWSDTHLLMGDDGYLYCYYRGVGMAKGYVHNDSQMGDYSNVIVVKKTNDGVNWTEREVVYSTETEGVDDDSELLSPAFFKYKNVINCFDVVMSTVLHPIAPQKGQYYSYIFRRHSKEETSFGKYDKIQIITLHDVPFGGSESVWHLDAEYFNGIYYLLLNVGVNGQNWGNSLFLAYSFDGWNYYFLDQPISSGFSYRSSITPISETETQIIFNIYRASNQDGHISLLKLTLNKQ